MTTRPELDRARTSSVLGGAAAGALLLAVLPMTGAEAASGRCSPGTGLTVVVDYGPL